MITKLSTFACLACVLLTVVVCGSDADARAELESRIQGSRGQTARVESKFSLVDPSGRITEVSGSMVMVQRLPDMRIDISRDAETAENLELPSQESTIFFNGILTECTDGSCREVTGAERDVELGDLESIVSGAVWFPGVLLGVDPRDLGEVKKLADRTTADLRAQCFENLANGFVGEFCFADSGVLVFGSVRNSSGVTTTFEAVSVDLRVQDADFRPDQP